MVKRRPVGRRNVAAGCYSFDCPTDRPKLISPFSIRKLNRGRDGLDESTAASALRLPGAPPRIIALERLIEAEHIREVEP